VSLQLPAIYDEFVERVFAKDRDQICDLSFVSNFARQFTAVGECAFGAAGECGCCGQTVLNVELWGAKITSVSGWVTQPAKRTRGVSHPAPAKQRFARPAAGQPEEADLWESRDQGCDEADHRCSG
jgi:hypothetical protein